MEVYNILFNKLLAEAAKRQASDLHLSVGSLPVARESGRLIRMEQEKIIEQETLLQIINSFLDEAEKKELDEKRELTTVKILGGHFRFKINIYYQKSLLAASFRPIPKITRGLSELGIPRSVESLTKLADGLVIIAGPYGSGKTATISAVIEHINQTSHKRILTLESPIEVQFVSKQSVVEQRSIGNDVLTLIDGLKYCQEEDIDVLAVSSIQEDFNQAIPLIFEIASGNCLVILEMNTDSVIRVIEKLLDCYPAEKNDSARMLVADVLAGIVVQDLLPKIGGGMSIALEVLIGTSAVKSVIREGKIKQIETIMQTSSGEGMKSMTQSLANLVNNGQVSREDALASAPAKEDLKIMIK